MKLSKFHPAARLEALAAAAWYSRRSVNAASGFIAELEHANERISNSSEHFPRTGSDCRRFVMLKYPFSVVFRETGTEIEIIAVAHHRKRPGYWSVRTAGA